MAVPEALTRFPQSISGLFPGLRQGRIGLWSSFPGPRLDSVGAVSYLVIMNRWSSSRPERRVSKVWKPSLGVPREPPSMGPGLVSLRPAAPDFERPEPGFEPEETADRLEQPGVLRGARRQAGRVPEHDARVG